MKIGGKKYTPASPGFMVRGIRKATLKAVMLEL